MATRKPSERRDFRQDLTDSIVALVESGTAPWQKPWTPDVAGTALKLPVNTTTGRPYRGANSLYLMARQMELGSADPRWCTYKQAQANGWQVRKGEKGSTVEYWQFEREEKRDGIAEKVKLDRPRVFYATVFNAQQIDGIPPPEPSQPKNPWEVSAAAERVLSSCGVRIHHDQQDQAYYSPDSDSIHLPPRESFAKQEDYYEVALHEIGHSTGHDTRLKRDLTRRFGSPEYAREELRAQMCSLYLSAELGVPFNPVRHAAYQSSWIGALRRDKNEIFQAARDAERMADYVIGLSREHDLTKEIDMADTTTDTAALDAGTAQQRISALHAREAAKYLEQRMKSFDWSYDYSDDRNVWERGAKGFKSISDDLKALAQSDPAKAASLWDSYANYHGRPDYLPPAPNKERAAPASPETAADSIGLPREHSSTKEIVKAIDTQNASGIIGAQGYAKFDESTDVLYSFPTASEAVRKAEEKGWTSFANMNADGSRSMVRREGDEWVLDDGRPLADVQADKDRSALRSIEARFKQQAESGKRQTDDIMQMAWDDSDAFRHIDDPQLQKSAANIMTENIRQYPAYRPALGEETAKKVMASSHDELNTMEPVVEKEQRHPKAQDAAQPTAPTGKAPGGNKVESDEIFTATQGEEKNFVPPEIEKRYLRVGNTFYNRKNSAQVAFEDKGNKLETLSNSETIAESMVRIAQARGWDEIKVSGSEIFRREAWLEAAAHGMHVRGYNPSKQDRVELAKRMERGSRPFRGRENGDERAPANKIWDRGQDLKWEALTVEQARAELAVEQARAEEMAVRDNPASTDEQIGEAKGTRKNAEAAAYQAALSADTPAGARLRELDRMERERDGSANTPDVAVDLALDADQQGKVVATEEKDARRNSWNVQLAEAFAKNSPEEAARQHPELASAAAAMSTVEKKALADGLDERQRAIVMERARQNVVNSIERGDIPKVRMKEEKTLAREVEQEFSR